MRYFSTGDIYFTFRWLGGLSFMLWALARCWSFHRLSKYVRSSWQPYMLPLKFFLMLKRLLALAVCPLPMRRCNLALSRLRDSSQNPYENNSSRYTGAQLFWVLLSISTGVSLGWELLAKSVLLCFWLWPKLIFIDTILLCGWETPSCMSRNKSLCYLTASQTACTVGDHGLTKWEVIEIPL